MCYQPVSFTPHLPMSFGRDTKSRWSLLSGVYARGSKRSHTGGKCVTCSWLTNSREHNSCVSPNLGCLEWLIQPQPSLAPIINCVDMETFLFRLISNLLIRKCKKMMKYISGLVTNWRDRARQMMIVWQLSWNLMNISVFRTVHFIWHVPCHHIKTLIYLHREIRACTVDVQIA